MKKSHNLRDILIKILVKTKKNVVRYSFILLWAGDVPNVFSKVLIFIIKYLHGLFYYAYNLTEFYTNFTGNIFVFL